jgi:hypothetical protein
MKELRNIFISLIILLFVGCVADNDPNWQAEQNAKKSQSHPLAGFWKSQNCKDDWGLAIGPMGEGKYYVSFCGPGGCFKEGTYRPVTTLYNDPEYKVIDENTIEVKGSGSFSVYVRCPGRKS